MNRPSEYSGEGLALLDLFLKELQRELNIFKMNLERIESGQYSLLIYDDLGRVSHSIHGAAKLINLSSIASITGALEHFCKIAADLKRRLSEDQIKLLSQVYELLCRIAANTSSSLISAISDLHNEIEQTTESLKSAISTEPSKISTEAYNNDSGKNDHQYLWSQFSDEVAALIEGLKDIKSPEGRSINMEASLQSVEKLLDVGQQLHIPIVETLTEALVSCFSVAINNQLEWTQGHIDLILEAVDFLSRLSEVEFDQIAPWLDKYKKGIESVAFVIAAISREASVLNKSKKSKKTPIVKTETTAPSAMEAEEEKQELAKKKNIIDKNILDLFYAELEQRGKEFNEGLLALEKNANDPKVIEGLMRTAHSIKGAARIVEFSSILRLAHVMEDYFQAVKNRTAFVNSETIDELFKSVDLFTRLSQVPHDYIETWLANTMIEIDERVNNIASLAADSQIKPSVKRPVSAELREFPNEATSISQGESQETRQVVVQETSLMEKGKTPYLRVSSAILNRLMGLAGESLVESRWLIPFSESLVSIKRKQNEILSKFENLHEYIASRLPDQNLDVKLTQLKTDLADCRYKLAERLADLELFSMRYTSLSDRLYAEVIQSRMRPFADGIESYPRMVRDLAKQLNKKVKLIIQGENTPVDREILEKLEAPITHLLRNAVDHGIEKPAERVAAEKNEEGTITLEAYHKAGMLFIVVMDDGHGIDIESLRKKVIEKGFVSAAIGEKLNENELLQFIFLPGFSTCDRVTEISGRGVGLNVVQNMVQNVGGVVKATLEGGLCIQMQLPLTLSVIRALLVEISEESYAIPLAHMQKVLLLPKEKVKNVEDRQYFQDEEVNIGLVQAHQILNTKKLVSNPNTLSIIVAGDQGNRYGIVVDRFIGEKELVVQDLDPILGKVPDVYGGAFMEDGSPLLILDVEDMIHSIDKLLSKEPLHRLKFANEDILIKKRILIVEDSVTVRETEAKLLLKHGYEVDTAVDGVDGWNALRLSKYDLVVTDLDMPRMSGLELVRKIRSDQNLHELPVIIVSYKENEGDRIKGLDAGGNCFLTKSSFHDETLVNAVKDLVG